jgi:membrane-bound serine protease (ClpP class)
MLTIIVGGFTAGVAIWLASRHIKSMPLLNRVILHAQVKGPGTILGTAGVGSANPMRISVGMEGHAISDLRPSGRAQFDGRFVDVSSTGSYVEKGARVRVVTAGQFLIEVEEVVT